VLSLHLAESLNPWLLRGRPARAQRHVQWVLWLGGCGVGILPWYTAPNSLSTAARMSRTDAPAEYI
jgi:hypothetical protein